MKQFFYFTVIATLLLSTQLISAQPQHGKAIVKDYFNALSKQTIHTLDTLIHDQFVFNDFTTGVTIKSKKEGMDYFYKVSQSPNKGTFKVKSIFRINDTVWCVTGKWKGTYSGKPVKARFITILILSDDGLIKRQTDHFDINAF